MSLWRIAWNYLWNRKLTTSMTILSVAISVGLISGVLILRDETERRFVEEGQSFDLVIGSESPLQVVLSSVYFMDRPTPNISFDIFKKLKADEEISEAFPVILGDSYNGTLIVGTSSALLERKWKNRVTGEPKNTFKLAEGKYFSKPFEAVLGAEAASKTGLKVGDTFAGQHGLDTTDVHEETPFTVVGILNRSFTPNDRVIFTDFRSMWMVPAHGYHAGEADHADHEDHDHEHEHIHIETPANDLDTFDVPEDLQMVSSVLCMLDSPGMRFSVQQRLRRELQGMVVAIPVIVIQNLYSQLIGTARDILMYIGYMVVVISSISILIGLYMSILQRKRDLAVMRALGASSGDIVGAVIIEAFWVTLLGIAAGWILGVGSTWALSQYLVDRIGFAVTAYRPTRDMFTAYSAVLLMGMMAGLIPAWQAYRTDVARGLSEL